MKRTIALCLLLVAACSGGSAKKSVSPDASASNIPSTAALACSKAASVACGGDIVGTWKLAGVCSHSMTQQQIIDQIYMREGGDPIEKAGTRLVREERAKWSRTHQVQLDPICSRNCLDVCVDYNNRYEELHGEG